MLARLDSSGTGFLTGGGEAGALMRSMDWSASPLGHPKDWPQSLRTVVSLLLNSKFPMFVAWGPELGFLYNDPYSEVLGAKHPAAMGRRFEDIWFEIWANIEPLVSKALQGEATFHEDLPLMMLRKGFEEQTYFTFSYSPVRDESGGIGGMYCACKETTAEVTARATLAANNEYLHNLFTQAPGLMAMLRGPEHVYEVTNDAYLELVGGRELIGKTVRDALPELAGQGFYELLDNVYLTGESFIGRQTPVVLQRQHGAEPETRYVDFIFQSVRDGQGRVTGIFIEGHDVTDLKLAENALRESEARHREILNSATDYAIISSDMEGRVTSWNEGARRVLGWTEDEMLGQPTDRFFTPEDLAIDQPRTEMQVALEQGRFINERYHQRRNGDRFWASGELTPLKDDTGTITGFVKVMRDQTEQRRAEEALRRYGVLVESMTEGVSVSDESGIIVYTNPAEDRMFGYGPDELVGQHVSVQNAYAPEENARRVEAVIAELQSKGSWEGEWTNRRKDGTEFVTASRITAVQIDGRTHWLCVQRDITEAKQAFEHQRLLIHELNHRVKNTLATVQALSAQSFRDITEMDRLKLNSFQERLFALSRAHDVLTRENWDAAELRDVITEVLDPYIRQSGGRFELNGPRLRLSPSMALAFAMAVHELATNAAKYGALSTATGRVSINWSVTPGNPKHFTFRWKETGGPPVSPPSRRGFGTRLIERTLASDVSGDVRLTYDPAGVVCTVRTPLPDSEHATLVLSAVRLG